MTTRTERTETIIQVIILLVIAGMAGAASFTHVHDWTMRYSPAGTGTWFGWANAIISELTPTAAGLEIRRRKRQHRPVTYPAAVLTAAVTLSLSAQFAQALPGPTGWLVSAVPALAFLALTKLLLSRTPAETRPRQTTGPGTPKPALNLTPTPAPSAPGPYETTSDQLLLGARMAAFTHQQATGQPITPADLAARLDIPPALAGSLLHAIGDTDTGDTAPPPVTAINGTPVTGSRP